METQFVMTVMAEDRPGLVESLARVVADYGGNWLESRMAHLGGQFAGILRVNIPSSEAAEFASAVQMLDRNGIKVHLQADRTIVPEPGGRRAELSLVGQDRPGIVRQISQVLARRNVNVEELVTECTSAPMTGEVLFHARAEVEIPGNCSVAELQGEFEKIASDMMVDIKLHEI